MKKPFTQEVRENTFMQAWCILSQQGLLLQYICAYFIKKEERIYEKKTFSDSTFIDNGRIPARGMRKRRR